MNEYIEKLIDFLLKNKISLTDELDLVIPKLNELIPFDFGRVIDFQKLIKHISYLNDIVGDSISNEMITIGIDPGGNFLIYDTSSKYVYYYDLCYNFTDLEDSLPEPEDFDIMTGYNSYLVAKNLDDLFDNILNNLSQNNEFIQ